MKLTLAELIDILSVTNIKIFFLIEKINQDEYTKEDAKKVQELNSYRSKLKNAISEIVKERMEIKT